MYQKKERPSSGGFGGNKYADRQPQISTENLSPVAIAAMGKKVFFKRKKTCPLSGDHAPKIDYKDVKLLLKFTSERGKVIPSRITAVSAKKQRELAIAIKRARQLALIAPVNQPL